MTKCTKPEHTNKYKNGKCADCKSEHGKKHYQANKESYYARNAAKKARIREYLIQYKAERCCASCGRNYPHYVMDLHHVVRDDKLSDIANINSWKALYAELEKCIVLCANCHREVTYGNSL